MIDLKVIPYDKKLAEKFIYDGVEKELAGENILPIVDFYTGLGSSFMGIIGEEIIGIGGIYKLWEGNAGCFLFLNQKKIQPYKKSVFKILLEYMDMLINKYEIKTLTVDCQDSILSANVLVEHLGFIKTKQVSLSVYNKG